MFKKQKGRRNSWKVYSYNWHVFTLLVLNGGACVAAKMAGPAVNLKILVPAVASGAIIGKGGETIAEIQKQTGTRIKMSKANDFYPGTTERVGLLQGNW